MGMLSDFARAFGDLTHPAIRRLLWISLGLTLATFAGLFVLVELALAAIEVGGGWVQTTFSWAVGVLGGLGALVLVWVLFPVVATFFAGLMLEHVAAALEASHYPDAPKGRDQPLIAGILAGLRFAAVAVAVNLAGLLVYAVLLLTVVLAPLAPVVFYVVNGLLLGREYFEMVALRHLSAADARALRLANRGRVFRAGAVVAVLLTIPVVNLAAPVAGVAAMVHIFHRMQTTPRRR